MSDKLKDFIDSHREELDSYEPRDLWSNIDSQLNTAMQPAVSKAILSKTAKWCMIGGFGASMLVGAYFLTNSEKGDIGGNTVTPLTAENKPLKPNENKTDNVLADNSDPEPKKEDQTEIIVDDTTQKTLPYAELPPTDNNASANVQETNTVTAVAEEKKENGVQKVLSFFKNGKSVLDTTFAGVTRIEIDADFCDVNIKGGSQEGLRFHGAIDGPQIITEKKDTVLKVYFSYRKKKASVITGVAYSGNILDFKVPDNIHLVVRSASGNMILKDVNTSKMELNSFIGDIKLENVNSDLSLKTLSGDLHLVKVDGDIAVETISGNQKYEKVSGTLNSQTRTGDIKAHELSGIVTVASSMGNQWYEDFAGKLNCKAGSGDLRINKAKGNFVMKTSVGDIIGKEIEFTDNSELESTSGDITVNLKNERKDLSFLLQTQNGKMVVKDAADESPDKNILLVNKGPILVKGATTKGDQLFQ